MKKLREYQDKLSFQAANILQQHGIVYLAMQVRTGKTATSLNVCHYLEVKKVLFLTKKKAMTSIVDDYNEFAFNKSFELVVMNNESLHKMNDNDFDVVIMDEAHRLGSFPKPCKMAKDLRLRFANKPIILLSGTPTPESYSQIYHQMWISNHSPFKEFKNFYQWANAFVNVKIKYVSYGTCNDYSDANRSLVMNYINNLMITYTQEQSGFKSIINEHVMYCEMNQQTYDLCNRLKHDLVIEGKNEVILAETGVKLMQKLHQMYSGTIKFESGNRQVIDYSKAEFIREKFIDKKIGIFYKFTAELMALQKVFGVENLTTDLDEFNSTSKNIALQIVSGREGISLKNADVLVYYNIDFSAVSYWQSRDRLTTMERKSNDIYWIFSKNGIEDKIYKAVMNKKDYTLSTFRKDYLC